MRWILALIFAVIWTSSGVAQRQLFHEYGAADGLDNLNVRCLFQDRVGFLWVGTDNGLFRYDGTRFRRFGHSEGLPDTEILNIAQSDDGRIWVGTTSGLSVLTGTRFDSIGLGERGPVRTIGFDASQTMYLQRESGVLRGTRSSANSYTFDNICTGAVSGLSVSSEGIFFSKDGDLFSLQGPKTERFGSLHGLPPDEWGATVLDSYGNRWVRSRTRLYELPRAHARFVDQSTGIPHATDTHLYTDRHGSLFVSTVSGIIGVSGTRRAYVDLRHGLPADPSGPMLIDHEDLLWLGTNGAGLVRRLGHGEWTAWTMADGLVKNSVWAIQTDTAGNVWVGTYGGLTILGPHGQVVRSWSTRNGLAGDRVLSIVEAPNGKFFAGTDSGMIAEFDHTGTLLRTYGTNAGVHASKISALAIDHEQRLWAVGTGGSFRSRTPVRDAPLSFDQITIPGVPTSALLRDIVVDDDDSIWVASSQGLHHLHDSQWKTFAVRDGLKSADLAVVAKDNGSIWIAYRDALGMTRIQKNGSTVELTDVTTQQGLRSDCVYAITTDRKGHLWVNTDMGVDVLANGSWKHFGDENGLIWNDTDSLALHVDSADNVWIGTSAGLSRYAQTGYSASEWLPPVVLTSIKGASREWQPGEEASLPYRKQSLTFQYAALTFEPGTGSHFRYRLTGLENEWNETSERSVHYGGLPPGNYVFQVVYVQQDGSSSSVPATFAFSIKSPWWKSWWFAVLFAITVTLIISGLVRMRVRLLEKQKEALELQVEDRTAELVASHRQLEEIAYFDMLTGCPNRRMFVEEFRRRAAQAGRSQGFALLLLDLDRFKQINDTFGHDAGDAVLIHTARRVEAELSQSDLVARLGGDEFAILLFEDSQANRIEALCSRILTQIASPIPYQNASLHVGCSIGIARFPAHGENQEGLYKAADLALYNAKQGSRNTFCWHGAEKHVEAQANVA